MLLDRHGEQRDDAEWIATMRVSASARYVLLRPDGRALVDGSRTALRGLRSDEAAALIGAAQPVAYLGSDASDWFLGHAEDDLAERVAGTITPIEVGPVTAPLAAALATGGVPA